MSLAVLLDSGPLGLLTDPKSTPGPVACRQWAAALLAAGRKVIVPEVTDYELRRELIRGGKLGGLAILNGLPTSGYEYLPLTTAAWRKAAELWAAVRRKGRPTPAATDIDVDAILAAQALTLGTPTIIATVNVRHLSLFTAAADWQTIAP